LTLEKDSSCTLDLEEELENWQSKLHEVSTRWCARITEVAHCMVAEVHDLILHASLGDVNTFFRHYEK